MKISLANFIKFILLIFLLSSIFIEDLHSKREIQTNNSPSKKVSQEKYYTFKQIQMVKDIPTTLKYLKGFISWKHWRYWLSILGIILAWFIMMMLLPDPDKFFSAEIAQKFKEKENITYMYIWMLYTFIIAIIFSFSFNNVYNFFNNSSFWEVPVHHHWTHWILWTGLALLAFGAVIDFVYNIFVFKVHFLYVEILHLIQGIFTIIGIFFLTIMLTYLIIGLGIIIGAIVAAFIVISIVFGYFKSIANSSFEGRTETTADLNNKYKRRAEDDARKQRRMHEQNRKNLEKTRGW